MSESNWTDLLKEANKLKREDKLMLIKSLAGTAGMIACFPNQMVGNQQNSASKGPKGPFREEKKKEVQEAKAPNPLHGSEVANAFKEAKKAVRVAKKGGSVNQHLLDALTSTKQAYFQALAEAKGEAEKEA